MSKPMVILIVVVAVAAGILIGRYATRLASPQVSGLAGGAAGGRGRRDRCLPRHGLHAAQDGPLKPAFVLLAGLLFFFLGGCAYRPLKAPCSADNAAAPLAYADSLPLAPAGKALATAASCGPMRPI